MLFNLLSVNLKCKSLILPIFFGPKNGVILHLLHIQVHYRLMEVNTINPDQTASFGAV